VYFPGCLALRYNNSIPYNPRSLRYKTLTPYNPKAPRYNNSTSYNPNIYCIVVFCIVYILPADIYILYSTLPARPTLTPRNSSSQKKIYTPEKNIFGQKKLFQKKKLFPEKYTFQKKIFSEKIRENSLPNRVIYTAAG